jgi:hypothetical protein
MGKRTSNLITELWSMLDMIYCTRLLWFWYFTSSECGTLFRQAEWNGTYWSYYEPTRKMLWNRLIFLYNKWVCTTWLSESLQTNVDLRLVSSERDIWLSARRLLLRVNACSTFSPVSMSRLYWGPSPAWGVPSETNVWKHSWYFSRWSSATLPISPPIEWHIMLILYS